MTVREIVQNSPDYQQMIELRLDVLLNPLGVPASYINQEKEAADYLIGAFEDRQLAGCCILTPLNNRTVQLRQMAVHRAWQGKGVGARILLFAEELAKKHGFTELIMHARNPVIDFYAKSGYTIEGPEFFEVGIGHHKMKKELS
jgi:predicted GNAT family N-acyltransferase